MDHVQAVAISGQSAGERFFCSWQFNLLVGIFIVSIFSRAPERRHPVFRWLITILASVFVVSGTVERAVQIRWGEWQDIAIGVSTNSAERYFILSLVSWIACIIADGYMVWDIIRAYQHEMGRLVQDFLTNWTVVQTVEKFGLFVSIASMANLGIDVFCNFKNHTSDTSLYVYFFLCVACKLSRLLIQGLVVTVDAANLVTRWNLISHLLVSHFILMVQIMFLAQFNPDQLWLSFPLMTGDTVYRTYQFLKINYYCCHNNHNDNSEVQVQEDITIRHFVQNGCNIIRHSTTTSPIRYITEDMVQESFPQQDCFIRRYTPPSGNGDYRIGTPITRYLTQETSVHHYDHKQQCYLRCYVPSFRHHRLRTYAIGDATQNIEHTCDLPWQDQESGTTNLHIKISDPFTPLNKSRVKPFIGCNPPPPLLHDTPLGFCDNS